MRQSLHEIETEFEAGVQMDATGLPAFRVYDVDDIGTGRAAVCPYGITEMLEAFDHADNRGGFVVNAGGAVVYVAPQVDAFEIMRSRRGRNNRGRELYDQLLRWIREHRG